MALRGKRNTTQKKEGKDPLLFDFFGRRARGEGHQKKRGKGGTQNPARVKGQQNWKRECGQVKVIFQKHCARRR